MAATTKRNGKPPRRNASCLPLDEPISLVCGDCLDVLASLPPASIDAVVCDPPYPEITRDYGRLSELAWFGLMFSALDQFKRILKPRGSAVVVFQPNMKHLGQMRRWPWEFLAIASSHWNLVQDVWWQNTCGLPKGTCRHRVGLLKSSMKMCVWLGPPNCYRDQSEIRIPASQGTVSQARNASNIRRRMPSGATIHRKQCLETAIKYGAVPTNLLRIGNGGSPNSAGAFGHGAGTPYRLIDWWVRYIAPPGGIVLDPFLGSGTTALACLNTGRRCLGIEKNRHYFAIARRRIKQAMRQNAKAQRP